MARRQEPGPPEAFEEALVGILATPVGDEDDERGKILRLAPQAVRQPRPQRGSSGLLRAGLDEGDRRVVIDRLGVHRTDETDPVDLAGGMGEQFADPSPVAASLDKAELWGDDRKTRLPARHASETLPLPDRVGELLTVKLPQPGLVVEELEMRRPARLEQINDPFRPRRGMRRDGPDGTPRRRRRQTIPGEQPGQRRAADDRGAAVEEGATVDGTEWRWDCRHGGHSDPEGFRRANGKSTDRNGDVRAWRSSRRD